MWRRTCLAVLGIGALAASSALPARASGDLPAPAPSSWEFDAGPYAWALWVQGDATTRGLTFDVYADPVDLIDALDGPIIMANFEARRSRFALYADVVYAEFGYEAEFLRSFNPVEPLIIRGDARIGADYTFEVYEAMGFYEIARFDGPKSDTYTTVELGGGARWVRQELDVTLAVDAAVDLQLARKRLAKRFDFSKNFELAVARSGVMEWVDPLAAARVRHSLRKRKSVTAMGNIGGFENDNFTWEALLTYDCNGALFGYETTTSIGYKALGLNFEEQTSKGARGVDVVLHGPVAEFKLRW